MEDVDTILLQVNNEKAYRLIKDLEALNIVKVLKRVSAPKSKLSERFAGSLRLSDQEHADLQDHLKKSRQECEKRICCNRIG